MKRSVILLVLLCLAMLMGCTGQVDRTETTAPESSITDITETAVDEQALVVGVWRNAGQYSEGRDFVETMTLDESGVCIVHLEYQGQDYQTLVGSYTVSEGTLCTEFAEGGETIRRDFRYTRDGRELILQNDSKTVTYIKVD